MNEDEALAQLRDIHLPAEIGMAASIQLATWPFITLAVVVGAILAIRFWSRYRWRRRARSDLSHILETEDQVVQWPMLLAFAKNLPACTGRKVSLPDLAYRHPDSLTDSERAAFIDFVSAELRR
ncbi:MAG: hypothetical protein ACR2QF_12565 [Geminicoccaceae bacterium]